MMARFLDSSLRFAAFGMTGGGGSGFTRATLQTAQSAMKMCAEREAGDYKGRPYVRLAEAMFGTIRRVLQQMTA